MTHSIISEYINGMLTESINFLNYSLILCNYNSIGVITTFFANKSTLYTKHTSFQKSNCFPHEFNKVSIGCYLRVHIEYLLRK